MSMNHHDQSQARSTATQSHYTLVRLEVVSGWSNENSDPFVLSIVLRLFQQYPTPLSRLQGRQHRFNEDQMEH